MNNTTTVITSDLLQAFKNLEGYTTDKKALHVIRVCLAKLMDNSMTLKRACDHVYTVSVKRDLYDLEDEVKALWLEYSYINKL